MKPYITIEGAGAGAGETIVQWGDTAHTFGPRGIPIGTLHSATFYVQSPYFIAKNITFKNTAPIPARDQYISKQWHFAYQKTKQHFGGADFWEHKTLCMINREDIITRTVISKGQLILSLEMDSLFEGCHLHSIAPSMGVVTAQDRSSPLEDTGFSFVNCKVTGSGKLYLGRAWGPFSRVVFAFTYMDSIIAPKGWYNWGDPSREKTVFYGQYKCTGPGSNFAGRVAWSKELTDKEAKPLLTLSYINGSEWINL